MKDLKVLVKWNLRWNFTCVCTITLNFKFIFSRCHGKLFSVLLQVIIYIFSFKMLLWSNFQYSFFYIFVHNKSLAKFQSITIIRTHVFEPLFLRIYSRHYFSFFQVLVENLSKWHHFLKNTTQVEIIITISVTNCTNIRAKVFHCYSFWELQYISRTRQPQIHAMK